MGEGVYADLAVPKTYTLPMAAVGSSHRLRRGERAIAIISPFGVLMDIVSDGVVRAAGQSIECWQGCCI